MPNIKPAIKITQHKIFHQLLKAKVEHVTVSIKQTVLCKKMMSENTLYQADISSEN